MQIIIKIKKSLSQFPSSRRFCLHPYIYGKSWRITCCLGRRLWFQHAAEAQEEWRCGPVDGPKESESLQRSSDPKRNKHGHIVRDNGVVAYRYPKKYFRRSTGTKWRHRLMRTFLGRSIHFVLYNHLCTRKGPAGHATHARSTFHDDNRILFLKLTLLHFSVLACISPNHSQQWLFSSVSDFHL